MTKHYESIDSGTENIYQKENFAALRFISVSKCEKTWQIQLSPVGWVVVM
jgi:hypothetical protein